MAEFEGRDGYYAARFLKTTVVKNKNTSNFQIAIGMEVFGRYKSALDAPGDEEVFPAVPRTLYLPCDSLETASRVLESLKVAGFLGEKLTDLEKEDEVWFDRDAKVKMELTHSEWQGKEKERWAISVPWVLAAGEQGEGVYQDLRKFFGEEAPPRRGGGGRRRSSSPQGAPSVSEGGEVLNGQITGSAA